MATINTSRPRKIDIEVGDTVTCKQAVQAYNRGPLFSPGNEGIVGAVRVPSVRRERVEFLCVDFERDGKKHRCALLYSNVKIIRKACFSGSSKRGAIQ